jgi:hypothetical protein
MPQTITKGIGSLLSGQLSFSRATLEAFRRGRATVQSRRERAKLDELASQPLELLPEFQTLSSLELLHHFRNRSTPSFLSGFEREATVRLRDLWPAETERITEAARAIVKDHRWPLLGFGDFEFSQEINWRRDPLSGRICPLEYHADVPLWHEDGSDIRVLWELNRFPHFITLGQAYLWTGDETLALEFFSQLESWREQNPLGRGPNWSCAMEVALRAMNLLTAFSCFRHSVHLTQERLPNLLTMFDQHAAHIRRNLEFSYVVTSNHYLTDAVGLLWLGLMLPELNSAREWRTWALYEVLREMDKQILRDGVDFEGSTGYHGFVLELLLYTFILCRANDVEIEDKYWHKLRGMLACLRSIVRPDGSTPLIGDSDGSHLLFANHRADDHSSLLAIGAAVFEDARFKSTDQAPPELWWLLGDEGLKKFQQLAVAGAPTSQAFPDAGLHVLRYEDLYLAFSAMASNGNRPTSHRHNDLLSVEVFANGRAFIVDPGTSVYTRNLHERHLFRSTAYHSTVQVDHEEQQIIREDAPFRIGSTAGTDTSVWTSTPDHDTIVAQHSGYSRLPGAVSHRRSITLHKRDRWWLIEDEISGTGEHKLATRFHFDTGLDVKLLDSTQALACDKLMAACLLVCALDPQAAVEIEAQQTSRHYGSKAESFSVCWTTNTKLPVKFRWALVPVNSGENFEQRISVVQTQSLSKAQEV